MKMEQKRRIVLLSILLALLFIPLFYLIFILNAPKKTTDSAETTSLATMAEPDAEAGFDLNPLSYEDRMDTAPTDPYLFPDIDSVVTLRMANGPGKPSSTQIQSDPLLGGNPTTSPTPPVETTAESSVESQGSEVTSATSSESTSEASQTAPTTQESDATSPSETINPSLILPSVSLTLPEITFPNGSTSATSAEVTEPILVITNPKAGDSYIAGSIHTLSWTFSSRRAGVFAIQLSIDGGATFETIAKDIAATSYDWTVPQIAEDDVIVRVDAYVESILYTSADSGMFSVTLPPTPTPTPTPIVIPPSFIPFTPSPDVAYQIGTDGFINISQDGLRWFLASIDTELADRAIWQLSKTPFSTVESDPLEPNALLATGDLAFDTTGAAGTIELEFAVDYTAIIHAINKEPYENHGSDFVLTEDAVLLPQEQYNLYLRVLVLDANGMIIGDADKGLITPCGFPLVSQVSDLLPEMPIPLVELWISNESSDIANQYRNMVHDPYTPIYVLPKDLYRDITFVNTPKETRSITIQVSSMPFPTELNAFDTVPGLVYTHISGEEFSYTNNTFSLALPLYEFLPSYEEIGDNTAAFYVRAVYLTEAENDPSARIPQSSEIQTIYCNRDGPPSDSSTLSFIQTQSVEVKSHVPYTTFMAFFPAEFEHPNAEEYYEVTRRILWNEMGMTLTTPDGVLYPYVLHYQKTGITTDEYQALLDKYLPVGASFHLTIKTHWYDEFVNLLSEIYGAIRDAYNGLQGEFADFVADNIPLIGDAARDVVRSAIKSVIKVGLAAIGLPPDLPDFERLAADGLDYCIEVAINEACATYGVPLDELPEDVRDQVTSEMTAKFEELMTMNHANPLGVDYLRPATWYQYSPGYITVFVQNFSDEVSAPGTLYASYRSETRSLVKYYESVRVTVPQLLPGDYVAINVYLTPTIGQASSEYFEQYKAYYLGNNGPSKFSVTVEYDIEDPYTLAAEQGLVTSAATPFGRLEQTYVYDHDPVYHFAYIGDPFEINVTGDESTDIMDFINDDE